MKRSFVQLQKTLTIWNSIIKWIEGLAIRLLLKHIHHFCRKIWFQCSILLYVLALALCTKSFYIIANNFLCGSSSGKNVHSKNVLTVENFKNREFQVMD